MQNDILPIQVCTGDNELSYQDLTSLYTQCHSDNNSHIICRNDIYFMECSYLQRLLISALYISATWRCIKKSFVDVTSKLCVEGISKFGYKFHEMHFIVVGKTIRYAY